MGIMKGRTACAVLEAGRQGMKAYTRPRRKEIISWIREEELDIMHSRGSFAGVAQDAAWRRAVETWLQHNHAITVSVCGKVLPCLINNYSH